MMATKPLPLPSLSDLQRLLVYEPDTGAIAWRSGRPGQSAGAAAGSVSPNGYLRIGINRRHYMAHRLAWKLVHGEDPPDVLDHVNGDTLDNRIANLRGCTASENGMNRRIRKTTRTGFKGVSFDRQTGKYRAAIIVGGKHRCLGRHTSAEAAGAAYQAASRAHFGEFHFTGKI